MRILPLLALASLLSAPAPTQPSSALTPGAVLLMAGGSSLDMTVLTAALADANPLVRAAAGRLVTVFGIAKLAGAVVTALEKEPDAGAAAEFVRALLILRGDAALALVEPHAQRIGGAPAGVLKHWRERPSDTAPAPAIPNDMAFSRVAPLWLPKMLAELSTAAGCKLPDNAFGYARLTYRADGRPSQVAIDPGKLSKECVSVLTAIARTTIADPQDRLQQGHQQWIVVPFSKEYLRCVDVPDEAPVARAGVSGIRAPTKVKHVRPEYPEDMQQARVQGMVVVEATISTTGCVVNARVLKSPAFGLELSALRAVSGWVFEPTRLDGKPVPVIMTVTVNFSLQ
jgi:TonB family protein